MKITYVERNFSAGSLDIIKRANQICAEYQRQGYDLTLRQLYYQFVSRGLIANKDTEYKRLGSIINDARLAGLLDWDYIVDRTRHLRSVSHWGTPGGIIYSAAQSYRRDKWSKQEYRPEVWIEKDALIGVLEGICTELDVPYFSCRGYTSQSEVWGAAQRMIGYFDSGQTPIVLHLGDHDPSGIDMTRDITDRLRLFVSERYDDREIEVRRLALNMDQVEQYSPPPNPAKLTDSRVEGYIAQFGSESWELDALDPRVITELIRDAIYEFRDVDAWDAEHRAEETERNLLQKASRRWAELAEILR